MKFGTEFENCLRHYDTNFFQNILNASKVMVFHIVYSVLMKFQIGTTRTTVFQILPNLQEKFVLIRSPNPENFVQIDPFVFEILTISSKSRFES